MSVSTPGLQSVGSVRPDALDSTLRAAARRIRISLLIRYCGRALCWSALPCAIAVGLSKFQWYDTPSPLLLAGIIGVAFLTAVVLACIRKLQPLDVAKLTERRTDLKERLSSAVEFRSQGIDPSAPFYGEQMSDANRHADGINLKTTFPIKMPWELPVGVLCGLLVFLAFYLPTLPRFWSKEHVAEVAEVKRMAIDIEKIAKEADKAANEQKLDETKKAATEAKKLAEAMKQGKLNKKDALVSLEKMTKKIEEKQQQLASAPAKKSMEQAHKDFQEALKKLAKEKEAKEAEAKKADAKKADAAKTAMQNTQKRDTKNPDQKMDQKPESNAMKQAKEAMQQMAEAMANQDQQQMQQAMEKMAEQMQKGEMSKEEMQQMQQAMQQLAKSLQDTNQQDAAQQMQQLAQMMEGDGNMDPKSLQQMASMMKSIGKQMGKGMGKGQLMDAKALGDLAQALKAGRLTTAMNGNGMGNGKMSNGHGGKGPGKGWNGSGDPHDAMKDPGATTPNLVAIGPAQKTDAKGKSGSAEEFAKYLAKASATSKHQANGKVAGVRSENGEEQKMDMMGAPQSAKSNSPYYQVVQTSKRQAESTLNKENIPASLKKQVKDYFDSIKP